MDICKKFKALHIKGQPLILANAWDAGSARVLVAKGAEAVGTSSAAHAFTLGRPDMGHITRDESLEHAQGLMAAVNVPVSGDFENGYGSRLEDVRITVEQAMDIGLAGCSIEDTALPTDRPYPFDEALKRVEVAAEVKHKRNSAFVLCARADGIMNGHYDVEEAIRRLQAFEQAGADVLYAPLPKSWDDLRRIIDSVEAPVNVLVARQFAQYRYDQFAEIGAARLSFGSAMARITHQILIHAADMIFDQGVFSDFQNAASGDTVDALLEQGKRP